MKKLLIIYPHWIPSNLVGVQRARLIANFLPKYGWEPIIVAVHPDYYEEAIVPELSKTVNPDIKVYWCEARRASSGRIIGDIALRGFRQLTEKALEVIREQQPDFIWSPLPAFYTSLICRKVHDITGVPYGLDYMDPWVHDFPGAKFPNKAWMAKRIAKILEPIAVKKASLLTGVTELSYKPVIERNHHLKNITTGYMPLGFDPHDYSILPDNNQFLWHDESDDILPIIYAGAFLPQSHFYMDILFSIISDMRKDQTLSPRIRFFFVGTGKGNLRTVSDYATKYGISDIVQENTERISYLEVLHNLSNAFGVLAIGNREPHYTASKIFQTILSGRRVFPVFHETSTVNEILKETDTDKFLVKYNPSLDKKEFKEEMRSAFLRFLDPDENWTPRMNGLDKYSADSSARKLTELLDQALCRKNV